MNRRIREDRETNMGLIKGVAMSLLFQEVIPCQQFGFIVYHPFTNTNTVLVRNEKKTGEKEIVDILHDVKGKRLWMNEMKDRIYACETPWQILYLMNKPYYFAFIKFAHSMMSNKDLGMILSHAWVSVEYSNDDANLSPKEMIHLLKSLPIELLMTEEDLKLWDTFPETLQIFRGVNKHNESSVNTALSWTLNLETARWFANRFDDNNEGKVYSQTVNKADVLAFFNTRNEMEVLIQPTGKELIHCQPNITE